MLSGIVAEERQAIDELRVVGFLEAVNERVDLGLKVEPPLENAVVDTTPLRLVLSTGKL